VCSDSTRNEQDETSVCRRNFDRSSANVTLFLEKLSKDVSGLESVWLVAGHLHFDKGSLASWQTKVEPVEAKNLMQTSAKFC